jgi:hypothetical protein
VGTIRRPKNGFGLARFIGSDTAVAPTMNKPILKRLGVLKAFRDRS